MYSLGLFVISIFDKQVAGWNRLKQVEPLKQVGVGLSKFEQVEAGLSRL